MDSNEEKFWGRLFETESGCWEPRVVSSSNGYTQVRTVWRRGQLTHRVAIELVTGEPIPEGMEVHHECGNRRCARPDHLRVVTREENNRLKDDTVLTREATEEIRMLWARGDYTQGELAQRYGVSRGHISNIVTLAYWRTA